MDEYNDLAAKLEDGDIDHEQKPHKKSHISKVGRSKSFMSEISEGSYNPKKILVLPLPDASSAEEKENDLENENKDKTEFEHTPHKVNWLTLMGSAIIISIACIDPGNLQGDIQVAQDMRYKSIWVLFFSHILLYFFQEMSIKVGVFSNKDVSQLIRLNYSKPIASQNHYF